MAFRRIYYYFIFSSILVHFTYAEPCPKFEYLDFSELKEYKELRLGDIKKFMDRDGDMLIFMSRIIQVFQLLFKGFNKKTTSLFDRCVREDQKLNKTYCFFKTAVTCLRQEYKEESSYYATWESACNPLELKRANALESVDWKPIHVHRLDNETVSILFNLAACVHLKQELTKICPQPCKTGDLCRGEDEKFKVNSLRCWAGRTQWKLLVGQVKMKTFDKNVRAFNYTCDCFSHLKWNYETLACEEMGQECDKLTTFPCSDTNTISCDTKKVKRSNLSEAVCTCKEGYYGDFCEFQINACTQKIIQLKTSAVDAVNQKDKSLKVTRVLSLNSSFLYTGNMLCNVNMSGESIESTSGSFDHNECFPELGTRSYQCKCVFPFQEDLVLKTQNCIIKRTACDQHLCLHGTCEQSPDERSEATCLCDANWEGKLCDKPAEQWSPWTDCQPTCGLDRSRSRLRKALESEDLEGNEEVSYRRIVQFETCSDRVVNACPASNYSGQKTSPYLTGKLKFVEQLLLSVCVGLAGFGFLLFAYMNIKIPRAEPSDDDMIVENI